MVDKGKDITASASDTGVKGEWVASNVIKGTIKEPGATWYIPPIAK